MDIARLLVTQGASLDHQDELVSVMMVVVVVAVIMLVVVMVIVMMMMMIAKLLGLDGDGGDVDGVGDGDD